MCGGTSFNTATFHRGEGLSPRVRGNRLLEAALDLKPGSIPACAGEPQGYRAGSGEAWVYPRVCGGTLIRQSFGVCTAGLSPRVRGNPACRPGLSPDQGSIPACAGEPAQNGTRHEPRRVYPRVCGGTIEPDQVADYLTGLSPRVRGNPCRRLAASIRYGSIPACAGEPLVTNLMILLQFQRRW